MSYITMQEKQAMNKTDEVIHLIFHWDNSKDLKNAQVFEDMLFEDGYKILTEYQAPDHEKATIKAYYMNGSLLDSEG